MKFRSTILLGGKTATGIPVPADVITGLGSGKRPAVHVSIGSYSYRSTVGSMNGEFMIPLSAEHREAAGLNAGDEIEVDLALDTLPRELAIPADFQEALDQEPVIRAFFDGLSISNRKRFVLSVEDAKTPETRQRRIEKAIATLREGRI